MINGSGGIPRAGREEAYATELWLEDPLAFWLHPEGPLSDTTPEEWRAKQPRLIRARKQLDHARNWTASGLSGSGVSTQQQIRYQREMSDYWKTLVDD